MKEARVGEVLVYPGIGLVKLIDIVYVNQEKNLIFQPLANNFNRTRIILSEKNYQLVGLREPLESKDIREVWGALRSQQDVNKLRRVPGYYKERTYSKIIMSANLKKIGGLAAYFFIIRQNANGRQLKYTAQTYYNRARDLLVSEIAYSLGKPEEEIYQKIQGILKNHHLRSKPKKRRGKADEGSN